MRGVQGDWEEGDGKLILAEGGKSDDTWSAIRFRGVSRGPEMGGGVPREIKCEKKRERKSGFK